MREFFLVTDRLKFSTWKASDLKCAILLWGHEDVSRFITAKGKMSDDEIENRLNTEITTQNEFGIQYWPVYFRHKEVNIGCCGLRPYDKDKNIVEFGVHLKKEYWGKGYAKEASLAVIKYAFETLKVDAIFAGHNPLNRSSSILLNKLGFKYIHDEYYEPTGLLHPSYLLKKEEYSANHRI